MPMPILNVPSHVQSIMHTVKSTATEIQEAELTQYKFLCDWNGGGRDEIHMSQAI